MGLLMAVERVSALMAVERVSALMKGKFNQYDAYIMKFYMVQIKKCHDADVASRRCA